MSDVHSGSEPMDYLTRLCEEMARVLERPEHSHLKAIIMLSDGDRGGMETFGYEDEAEASADMFMHLRALFATHGVDLEFVPIPDSPQSLLPDE